MRFSTASRPAQKLAQIGVELGLYVSFSGILTFKNSEDIRRIAATVPHDRLLVETDAPYLAPRPYRGKTNEPAFVAHTAHVLAEVIGVADRDRRGTDDGQFLPPVREGGGCRRGARARCWPHDAAGDDPRLRVIRRRAAGRRRLGRLRSVEPEEPAPALLDPARESRP